MERLGDLRALSYHGYQHLSSSFQLLTNLAEAADLRGKIDAMFDGVNINTTEDRAVLHVATRARRDQVRMGRRLEGKPSAAHTAVCVLSGLRMQDQLA